jgi:hypothetical protein
MGNVTASGISSTHTYYEMSRNWTLVVRFEVFTLPALQQTVRERSSPLTGGPRRPAPDAVEPRPKTRRFEVFELDRLHEREPRLRMTNPSQSIGPHC